MSPERSIQRTLLNIFNPQWLVSAAFVIVLVVLFLLFYREVAPQSSIPDSKVGGGEGIIEVYFSAPHKTASKTLRGGPDAFLAASIASAQHSVDIAAYNLDLWSIRDALIEAYRSGATVRMVVEGSNLEQPEVQDLIDAGIEVVSDEHEALMHHKFVVVDQWDVWTGSMNFTLNGSYRNDNNLLHIQSRHLAQNYVHEFEEMFLDRRFGKLSRRDTPFTGLEIEGARMEVFFSPDDNVSVSLMGALEGAQEQVLVMAYTLTADELTALLIEQAQRGLEVRVLMEADQIRSTGNDFTHLQEGGVDAVVDGNPYNMHHKVILIDGQIVIAGSYNFTRSAEERNDENLVIIQDSDLAEEYLVEFTRIWETAQR